MKETPSKIITVTSSLNEISTDQLSPYFKPFKAPRNRFPAWRAGTTTIFVVPPTKLHRLAKSMPWNRFLGSLNVYKYGLWLLVRS
jgi:hypothetical protein